jgi:hypothetical protein
MTDQILINTTDSIEIDIYYNNELVEADSIIITSITNPNGVVILTNQAVTEGVTTGRYSYQLNSAYANILGVYTAVWTFVVAGFTFKHTQYFQVVSSITTGYITPYDVRQGSLYSEITATEPSDATLQKYIDRSTQIIDNYLGGTINYGIYTEKVRCVLDKVHNGVHIQLHKKPIISLTSVQLIQGAQTTLNLDVDYVRIKEDGGYLEYFQDISVPTLQICTFDPTATQIIPMAVVVYTAGYVTVPEPVKLAAILLVEELFRGNEGDDMDLVSYKIGDTTETRRRTKGKEQAMDDLGLSGSQSIIKLLRPYCHPFTRVGLSGPLG